MNPGRELDKLVAEKVFELKVVKHKSPTNRDDYAYEAGGGVVILPHYSTHIAAAWEVVEAFPIGEHSINIFSTEWKEYGMNDFENGWICQISSSDTYGVSKSIPHAICLAALAAKGVEVD